ncbi:phosphopantothenate--cysteine ligase [Streptococcus downei]|uniref:Phosphopantothenate--cysteine ligase n=1 Tax=Streptococcus downei MFe28 TaxID=764290 RepID=A0A380JEJ8_STRDO|nr:phosphopantothenate--cysteine ligase [Streptococcus downei]EFQ57708.1 phosphopantothenate--cysteine ligase [Streptococcus downei F0415]SUN36210.1 phosphopantothenate--cysteine ligase [Streptococcus downei MFe28]
MKILITSGGTSEKIDQVRSITNHASGNLGKIMAELFLKNGHQVTLVTTKSAVKPDAQAGLNIKLVSDVASLQETLEPLVKSHQVLIHSMAVSDYRPVYMTDLAELQTTKDFSQLLNKKNSETKISSAADNQVLFLKKNPKIISLVKEWNPDIRLIGFKLLVDVPKEELWEVARSSLKRNQAELIVANDLLDINEDQHLGYLVDENTQEPARTKQEIAQKIYERISKHD